MKIRKGFVSNSSSSSFVIIGSGDFESDLEQYIDDDGILVIGDKGHTEFGWEYTEYRGLFDRINFAYLLILANPISRYAEMLYDVLKEQFGCEISFILTDDYETPPGFEYGYIDHQSCGGDNMEIYEDVEKLRNFIFCKDSYIQGDNDNR